MIAAFTRVENDQFLHATVNSWCWYQQTGGMCSLKDFIVDLSTSLMGRSTPYANDLAEEDLSPPAVPERSLSANQVPSKIRYDKHDHWPIQVEGNAMRCTMPGCKRRSRFMRTNCKVCLCVIGACGCFMKFHVPNC